METELVLEPPSPNPEVFSSLSSSEQIRAAVDEVNVADVSESKIEDLIGGLWRRLRFVTEIKKTIPSTLPERFGRGRKLKEIKALRNEYQSMEPDEKEFSSMDYHGYRKSEVEQQKRRVRIEKEFHDQKSLTLHHPEWDNITAYHVVLNQDAPEGLPPIVYIGGASNGVESGDSFLHELAMRYPDRKIYGLGYPDAASRGEVTEKFYEAVKSDPGLTPHAQFFEAEIKHLVPQGDIELIGHSAGSLVIEQMLPKLVDRVANATLMSPAGCVETTKLRFYKGIISDLTSLITNYKNVANYVFLNDPTTGNQKDWKFGIFEAIGDRAHQAMSEKLLSAINMRPGSKIVVVSGADDLTVNSAEYFNSENIDELHKFQPALEVTTVPKSAHTGPFMEPSKYLDAIDEQLHR